MKDRYSPARKTDKPAMKDLRDFKHRYDLSRPKSGLRERYLLALDAPVTSISLRHGGCGGLSPKPLFQWPAEFSKLVHAQLLSSTPPFLVMRR